MFTLSLVDPVLSKKAQQRLNPGDELPLYAECIDKALNESSKLAQDTNNLVEHIRLNIEWRSYDDISGYAKNKYHKNEHNDKFYLINHNLIIFF